MWLSKVLSVGDNESTRRTQAQRRAQSRTKLMLAAAELIAEQGLGRVTLAEIGKRAGYSRGIANHHFGTKAALIAELVDRVEREFIEASAPALRLQVSVDELVEIASVFVAMLADLPAVHRAFLVLWATAVADEELRPRMAGSDESFRNTVVEIVERGRSNGEIDSTIGAPEFAVAFLGQLRGIALQLLLAPEAIDLGALRHSMEQSLRRTLRPAPGHSGDSG